MCGMRRGLGIAATGSDACHTGPPPQHPSDLMDRNIKPCHSDAFRRVLSISALYPHFTLAPTALRWTMYMFTMVLYLGDYYGGFR